MIKKEKGITLTMLAATVIVIIILAGTAITASDALLKDTRLKTVSSNMYLVARKAETIYEEFQFNHDENSLTDEEENLLLPGTKTNAVTDYGVPEPNVEDKWYIWDQSVLTSLGFAKDILKEDAVFIVNYATGEVIYTRGVTDSEGTTLYTLTDLLDSTR